MALDLEKSDGGAWSLELGRPKIVFFGSGPVAALALERLAKNFEVEAVVTKPKPPHHKGDFPVIKLAQDLNLKLYEVSNKKELSTLIATKPFLNDVAILIDFGIIVAQDTIDYFKKGIINSHFSMLPKLRGADPITFSILENEVPGVSLMLLVEAMDEGPLLAQEQLLSSTEETNTTLTNGLIELSDTLLTAIVPRYISGEIQPKIQPKDIEPTYSRKLTKEDGRIDISKPAVQLEREIRAYIEWPKSYTVIAGKDVIITKAHVESGERQAVSGKRIPDNIFVTDEKELALQTSDGVLIIDNLKPAGKKEMTAKEFLVGYGNNL